MNKLKKINKKYNLFLDDERFPYVSNPELDDVSAFNYTNYNPFKYEKWVIVRNFNEFTNEVKKRGLPEKVSFDNDLGDVSDDIEKTGYDCVKWLCNYCQDNKLKFPEYYIHSMNPTGSNNMKAYINNYKKYVDI